MQTLLLGFDAFDPKVFDRLSAEGQLPNLTQLAEQGGYSRFAVSDPPQSEVSWTSIATGLDPGSHGIFDFVHRDPRNYSLQVSLLPMERHLGATRFVPPFDSPTLFDETARQGYPATALWWPATFPARLDSLVRAIPGLGVPDILGKIGVGTLFTTNHGVIKSDHKTAVVILSSEAPGRFSAELEGPARSVRGVATPSTLEVQLEVRDESTADLRVGNQSVTLRNQEWSPVLELTFKLGRFVSVRALTRATLTQTMPEVMLYLLPLQLHPIHPIWPYATPRKFVKDTWKSCGPFLTLGWPQDTTGLEEGCIADDRFLDLCSTIIDSRECVLMDQLGGFREGVLACVFDSLDRIQHMFWRDRPDVVKEWYGRLDRLLGRVTQLLDERQEQVKLLIASDHGFSDFHSKVHLNRWLVDNGYLVPKDGSSSNSLQEVDWTRSTAYALGLNSLYINLQGREGQGVVPSHGYQAVVDELQRRLLEWQVPRSGRVVSRTVLQSEAFSGPFSEQGPDLVVGYAPGFRASAETGLGQWGDGCVVENHDHWGADHCMDSLAVPGVLFCNQGLQGLSSPSYRDMPTLAIGVQPAGQPPAARAKPRAGGLEDDDEQVIDRLRGLGYL